MVLAHSNSLMFIDLPIGMFHMPLFFIMSGYCLKNKYFSVPHIYVWKKIKSLWWLFVKYSVLFIILHNIFYYVNIYDSHFWNQHLYSIDDFYNEIFCVFMHMEIHELLLRQFWFIKTLLWSSLIAFIILFVAHRIKLKIMNSKIEKFGYGFLILCAVGGAICINYIHKTFTIFYISPREFLAATFFMIGYCFALFKMKKFSTIVIILSFVVLLLNSSFNFLRMKSDFYDTDKIIPYAITAVLATWSVYSLPWNRLKGIAARMLQYIGNNTLPILIWHFLCFKIVSLLIILCYGLPVHELGAFHVIYRYADKGWFLLYTIVGVFIPIAIAYLSRRIYLCLKTIRVK